jgi:hypothetical protein
MKEGEEILSLRVKVQFENENAKSDLRCQISRNKIKTGLVLTELIKLAPVIFPPYQTLLFLKLKLHWTQGWMTMKFRCRNQGVLVFRKF